MTRKLLSLLAFAFVGGTVAVSAQNNKIEKPMKALIVFFSHTGENYGVGHITKGNTHLVAEVIAEKTGGRLFEIEPVEAYPQTYQACVDVAKQEKAAAARPKLKGDTSIEEYDVIFIGYPNWWGDMPMAVYSFIEKHQWQGKTVVPFCTHEGSGLSSTERALEKACDGAKVLKGLALRGSVAQKEPTKTETTVMSWLEKTL